MDKDVCGWIEILIEDNKMGVVFFSGTNILDSVKGCSP